MHAVLLLSHKGFDYIKNFLKQFDNDNRFCFYIHYDKKSTPLTNEQKEYLFSNYNIRLFVQEVDCHYSRISIIDAELLLIKYAILNNDVTYIHLMSEQCYLTVSPDKFNDYFENNNNQYIWINEMINTIDCYGYPNSWRIINNKYHYFGGQWFSLTRELLRDIYNNTALESYYNELKFYSDNPDNDTHRQAIDEAFFQNFIVEFGYINKYNFVNYDLRFVDWLARDRNSDSTHPGLIIANMYYSNNQLSRIISGNYLIVRKVDYKNEKCIKQLNTIKQYYNNKEMNISKVSVCMCTRNRAILMLPAIKSVLTQTYDNIEFIIVDDCSTDNTKQIIDELKQQYDNIKYIRLDNHDFINARNTAFRHATGDYIALIDSDDLCSPNKIEEQVKYLKENPDIDVVGCKIKFGKKTSNLSIPKSTIEWDNDYLQNEIKSENISMLLHFPAIMFRREVLKKFTNDLYFYPELVNGGEDQIFLYTLFLKGAKFGNCTSCTYLYNYLEYDDAISATAGKHFDESNFIFKYIHGKPFDDKMKIVNELFDKYNKKDEA